jgi:transposase
MFYAGIDAHAQYLRVAVLDKDGAVVNDGTVSTRELDTIKVFLAPHRPLQVVVETCPFWPWLRDQLEEDGVQFHLAHARELRAIAQHAQKNDAVDAHLLARMLLAGLIPPAHAHSTTHLDMLRLVRHYAWLTRYRTMCTNRIHAQLHQSGVRLARERLLQPKGQEQVRALGTRLSIEQRRLIRTHLVLIKGLNQMLRGLRKQIRRTAAQSPAAALLQSVSGIGPYWGLLLGTELTPIERFRSVDHLISYAGLAPITHTSGGQIHHGPLPKAANRWVRGAFVAAAMSHVHHAPQSRLSQYYLRMKTRIGWKKARVATARKLARAVYGMLRSRRPWHD